MAKRSEQTLLDYAKEHLPAALASRVTSEDQVGSYKMQWKIDMAGWRRVEEEEAKLAGGVPA